ncbi:MAG: hypothetical protein K2Q33_03315 [Gammaproteobacteria bacterium]|nr:hypothetical protein [Gammaproteobacteria bacterium]
MASVGSIPVVERLHSFVSARLDMLKEAYQPQDGLLRIHRHWVITALSQILNKESNKQNEKELLDALIDFLKTQSTLITYTAAPDSLLVSLYCSIAVVTAQTANRTNPLSDPHNKPVGVLNLLMPALRNTEALSAEYPELQPRWDEEQKKWLVVDAPSLDIRKILKQHIISSNRLYLLPVRAVCHYITDSFVNDPICNVYFNDLQCENFDTDLYLTEDEITRISQHSELTQSFFAAKKAHIRYGEDSPTLLGALIELREALRKSSKQGEGNEYHADPTILLATRKCKNFMDGLTAVQRQAIPPDLSQQLNELFQLSDLLPDDGKGKTNCTDIIGNTIGRFIETYNELLQNIEGYPANSFLPALRKARQALL